MIKKINRFGKFYIGVLEDLENKPNHRRTIAPIDDISTEPPEVQTACAEAWTPEVIEAYQAHLESAV